MLLLKKWNYGQSTLFLYYNYVIPSPSLSLPFLYLHTFFHIVYGHIGVFQVYSIRNCQCIMYVCTNQILLLLILFIQAKEVWYYAYSHHFSTKTFTNQIDSYLLFFNQLTIYFYFLYTLWSTLQLFIFCESATVALVSHSIDCVKANTHMVSSMLTNILFYLKYISERLVKGILLLHSFFLLYILIIFLQKLLTVKNAID